MSQVFFFPDRVSILPHHFVLSNTMSVLVSFALCNLLTFTALPTSFPHSPPFMQFCSVLLYLTPHLSYSPLPVQSFPTTWVLVLAGFQLCVMYFRCFFMGDLPLSTGSTAQIQSLDFFGAVDLANSCIGALFRGSTRPPGPRHRVTANILSTHEALDETLIIIYALF